MNNFLFEIYLLFSYCFFKGWSLLLSNFLTFCACYCWKIFIYIYIISAFIKIRQFFFETFTNFILSNTLICFLYYISFIFCGKTLMTPLNYDENMTCTLDGSNVSLFLDAEDIYCRIRYTISTYFYGIPMGLLRPSHFCL